MADKHWLEKEDVVLAPEAVTKLKEQLKEPKKVPLVIYIEHDRKVIGEAIITENEVQCQITEEGKELAGLATLGSVGGITASFSFDLSDVFSKERYPGIVKKKLSIRKRDGE